MGNYADFDEECFPILLWILMVNSDIKSGNKDNLGSGKCRDSDKQFLTFVTPF